MNVLSPWFHVSSRVTKHRAHMSHAKKRASMLFWVKFVGLAFSRMRVVSSSLWWSQQLGLYSTIAARLLSVLAPLPALLGLQFCAGLLHLGGADPHGVPWKPVRPQGSSILKTLGSVVHEGPVTQNEDICQALATEAFMSICQACMGALCSGSPWHHCLHLHVVQKSGSVFTSLSLLLVAFSRPSLPVFLAWHCVSHAPAFRCHREIITTLEAGACAGSRACCSFFCVKPIRKNWKFSSKKSLFKERHVEASSEVEVCFFSCLFLFLHSHLGFHPLLVSITPQITCFRGAKEGRIWLQEKVTINSYSLTTS